MDEMEPFIDNRLHSYWHSSMDMAPSMDGDTSWVVCITVQHIAIGGGGH